MQGYAQSFVTYLDILGFQHLIEERSCSEIAELLSVLSFYANPTEADKSVWHYSFKGFSDLVVRSFPLPRSSEETFTGQTLIESVFAELQALTWIQSTLIGRGVLLRGAVTIGALHSNSVAVFGPALNRAYLLESTIAHYPRIVVDPCVFDALKHSDSVDVDDKREHFVSALRKDSDGVWFVDYLKGASDLDDTEGYPAFLHRHKQLIESYLTRHSTLNGVSQKLTWMANYHNSTVEDYIGTPLKQLFSASRNKPNPSYWTPGFKPKIDKRPVGAGELDDGMDDSRDEEVGDLRMFLVEVDIPRVSPSGEM